MRYDIITFVASDTHEKHTSDKEYGSMVKRLRHRPFTAVTRVRFPLESYLSNYVNADVAQLAEQLICNQQVIGSSPIIGLVPKRDLKILDL